MSKEVNQLKMSRKFESGTENVLQNGLSGMSRDETHRYGGTYGDILL